MTTYLDLQTDAPLGWLEGIGLEKCPACDFLAGDVAKVPSDETQHFFEAGPGHPTQREGRCDLELAADLATVLGQPLAAFAALRAAAWKLERSTWAPRVA